MIRLPTYLVNSVSDFIKAREFHANLSDADFFLVKPAPIMLDKSPHQIQVDKNARIFVKTSAVLDDPPSKKGRKQDSPKGVPLKTADLR
jgi:hypothetical protein